MHLSFMKDYCSAPYDIFLVGPDSYINVNRGRWGALTRTEFLDILSDPDYMAEVHEKLNMLASFH